MLGTRNTEIACLDSKASYPVVDQAYLVNELDSMLGLRTMLVEMQLCVGWLCESKSSGGNARLNVCLHYLAYVNGMVHR